MKRRPPLLDENEVRKLLEENPDDTDSDPDYLPLDYKSPSPRKRVCRPLFESNNDVPTKANTPKDVLKLLESRLNQYRKQWHEANGIKPTMRRKMKRIKQLEEMMKGVLKGDNIDTSKIPNPFSSPPKKKVGGCPSTGDKENFEKITNDSTNSRGVLPIDTPRTQKEENMKKSTNDPSNCGGLLPIDSPRTRKEEKMKKSTNDPSNCGGSLPIDSPRTQQEENMKKSTNDSSNCGGLILTDSSSTENEEHLEKSVNDASNSDDSLLIDSRPTKGATITRKQNYCIACEKFVKEFCKHYQTVHRHTEEGLKLQELNKIVDKNLRKKLKTEITDILRKKGNYEFSKLTSDEMFMKKGKATVIPVKRCSVSSDQNNTVQCAHCLGFYKRRKFSVHIKKCKPFLENSKPKTSSTDTSSNLEGNVTALKQHSLPVINKVVGASTTLLNEVLAQMAPRITKDVAMKDSLIMRYSSEFQKTRREHFQKDYVCRVVTDLAKILMRMQEFDNSIKCLEDVFNPAYFNQLVTCILQEAGYDEEKGSIKICGLGNRLRSHIRGAAETALKDAAAEEHKNGSMKAKSLRKRVKHFLKLLEDKWANEAGRIFDQAVKQSRTQKEPKLAAEEDIVKTCQFVSSKYRTTIKDLDKAASGSVEKQQCYNRLLDFLVTHIMCLIRRRPVDFKRAQNMHYQKLDSQEDLINEIKNSKHMNLSEKDLELCNKFQIFYVPGKGWKEMVPIALTNIMKEAMDVLQRNKKHVGIDSKTLFVRAKEMHVNPRECLRRVTKQLVLKKPLDLSGNGLRHHAGTFSKLHSSHPNYQDYLASALGHTLHIHRLHYEMPTSIVQKLIVCPVLHNMTQPVNERQEEDSSQNSEVLGSIENVEIPFESEIQCNIGSENTCQESQTVQEIAGISQPLQKTPEKISSEIEKETPYVPEKQDLSSDSEESYTISKKQQRTPWTADEKMLMYVEFGKCILEHKLPPRHAVHKFFMANEHKFKPRSVASLMSFLQSKCTRRAKNVTPEVKKCLTSVTHRKITNVPL